jgi:hypothetical protein
MITPRWPRLARRRLRRGAAFRPFLTVECLESRTLLTAGGLVTWTMDDDGILGGVADPSQNLGQVGQPDPPIRLAIGDRALIHTADWYNDPLEIVAKGSNAFHDVVLLAQDSINPGRSFASGARSPGLFQNDPAVNFVDDPFHHTISFTVTPALANAMMDPAHGLTPGYRCGNQEHRNSQRGDFIIVSGDPAAKDQQQLDGVGNSFDTAAPAALGAAGAGSVFGAIRAAGNQDIYQVTAPVSGTMTVTLAPAAGSTLQGVLFVYGADGRTLTYHAADAAGQADSAQVGVVAGQSYFIEAAGFTTSTGGYTLSLATAPTPGPFPGAGVVPLDDTGVGSIIGAITTPGQVDSHSFVAPVTGRITIRQDAAPGSALDSQLAVYDQAGTLLASNVHGDGGLNSRLQVDVVAGQSYLVQSSGRTYVTDTAGGRVVNQALSTGAYQLTFTTQDFGSTFDTAQVLSLDPFDTGSQTGTLTTADQQDLFRFAVPVPGRVVAVLTPGPGSHLRGAVSVFDGSRTLLGNATDSGQGSVEVSFTAAPGQNYYAQASSADGSTGRFTLYVTEDDDAQGDTKATAVPIDVSSGFAMDYEATQDPGDADWRRFTPTSSGLMRIRQFAVDGTPLDTHLSVYDASGALLAANDDDGSSTNSQITLPVTAGTTYYIVAAGVGNSTGHWNLTLSMDNTADAVPTATFLDASSGSAAHSGTIGGAGDVDLFRFTAPASGPLPVAVNALFNPIPEVVNFDPSLLPTLDSRLTVFDASGKLIAQDANSGGAGSLLVANVVQGATYYVQVEGFANSAGAYRLVVGKEHGSTPATASPLPLDASDSGSLAGRINFPQDQDWYHFRPPVSGQLAVVESVGPFSGLLGQVAVYDAANHLLGSASNDPAYHGAARVLLNVTAGQDYYVQVHGLPLYPHGPTIPGPYTLTVSVPAPNSTPAAALPLDLSAGTATAGGDVNFPGAAGWFKFVAPVTGLIGIEQSDPPGTFLTDVLTAYAGPSVPTAAPPPLGTSIGFGQGFASLELPVTAGQTYYVQAAGFQNFTGPYSVSVSVLPTGGPQLRPTDLGTVTAQDLVNSLLGTDSGITVVPGSVHYTGSSQASGVFAGGTGIVGFESGALLTTGSTADVVGPNFTQGSPGYGVDPGLPGDPDLDQLVQGGTHTAAVLSFDFVPSVNVVQLSYVFASSEYTRFAASAFDDVFGAFVNGVDYARLPGTGPAAPGSGTIVSVNTVNGQTNSAFFIDNSIGPSGGLAPRHTQMNGLTTVLTLRAPVVPGQVNHLKLAIANAVDPLYTSAVFLQGGSFHTDTETVTDAVGHQGFDTLVAQASAASAGGLLVNNAVVDGLLRDRNLLGDFLVIPVDPVDFTLTDPNGQQITKAQQGLTQSPGSPRNPFFATDGTNTLLIVPNAVQGLYRLALVGVGPGNFQLGANYVTAFGQVTSYLLQGALQDGRTVAVLDFRPGQLDGRVEVQTVAVGSQVNAGQTVATLPPAAANPATPSPGAPSTPAVAGPQSPPPFAPASVTGTLANAVALFTGLVTTPLLVQTSSAPLTGSSTATTSLAGLGSGGGGAAGPSWAALLDALDRVFGDWLPAAETQVATGVATVAGPGLHFLEGAAAEVRAAWHEVAGDAVPVPDLHLAGAAAALRGWLLQAERLAADDVGRFLRAVLPGTRGVFPRRLRASPPRLSPGRVDAAPLPGTVEEDAPRLTAESALALVLVSGAYQACWADDEDGDRN